MQAAMHKVNLQMPEYKQHCLVMADWLVSDLRQVCLAKNVLSFWEQD